MKGSYSLSSKDQKLRVIPKMNSKTEFKLKILRKLFPRVLVFFKQYFLVFSWLFQAHMTAKEKGFPPSCQWLLTPVLMPIHPSVSLSIAILRHTAPRCWSTLKLFFFLNCVSLNWIVLPSCRMIGKYEPQPDVSLQFHHSFGFFSVFFTNIEAIRIGCLCDTLRVVRADGYLWLVEISEFWNIHQKVEKTQTFPTSNTNIHKRLQLLHLTYTEQIFTSNVSKESHKAGWAH